MNWRCLRGLALVGGVIAASAAGAALAVWAQRGDHPRSGVLVAALGPWVPEIRRAVGFVHQSPIRASRVPSLLPLDRSAATLTEERELMLLNMKRGLGLSTQVLDEVAAILRGSPAAGTGNPRPTHHPMTRGECVVRRRDVALVPGDEGLCGAKNMVALFDPTKETERDARACIDQYEFPNVPCEYPLVWVTAFEAAQLCHALGKRLCDAHEWEGACAGRMRSAEEAYSWKGTRIQRTHEHNRRRELLWAYGPTERPEICGTGGEKSPRCVDATWQSCGSNTYPAGAFPDCVSLLGVYDLHGNVAEHMSLPMVPAHLASRGGFGQTEMKGSWFASGRHRPHPDDCNWRAPSWHASSVGNRASHANYHLGFRCCKSLPD